MIKKEIRLTVTVVAICILHVSAQQSEIDLQGKLNEIAQQSLFSSQNTQQNELFKKRFSESRQQTAPAQTLDVAVNDSAYNVGVGDEFIITFTKSPANFFRGSINANSDLYIPELGLVHLKKMTLVDAKNTIAKAYAKILNRSDEIYVCLSKAKTVAFTVVGRPDMSGTYQISGTKRLSDALLQANNTVFLQYDSLNMREVICKSSDSTRTFDLLKFMLVGDMSNNPYIYPDDIIYVTAASKKVLLLGAICSPIMKNVPIKSFETVAEFLSLFKLEERADTTAITLQTSDNENKRIVKKIPVNADVILKDRDIITIQSKPLYPEYQKVELFGEIVKPGIYPVIKGETSVTVLLDLAGGPSDVADMNRAVIIRPLKNFDTNSTSVSENINKFLTVRPEMNSAFSTMSTLNDYSIIKIVENRDAILENGDKVFLPKIEHYVYVSGAVKHAGAYPYVAGKEKSYYIYKAGGFVAHADRSNVIKLTAYANVVQANSASSVQQGDVIIVPVAQQYKSLSMIVFPMIQAVLTAASVLLAIITTVNNN